MTDHYVRPVFAVCVNNDGCDDLSAGMIYRVLPAPAGVRGGPVRIVDDTGGDYLYPATRFVVVHVPHADVPQVMKVASAKVA